MAVTFTFTASEVSGVRYLPAKILTKTSLLSLSTTLTTSASSVRMVLLCKVPHNAVILDFIFFVNDAAGSSTANQVTANTWQLGIYQPEGSASNTSTLSAISPPQTVAVGGSALRPAGVNLPYRVSISEECNQRWAWITATPSIAALSASAVMRFTVKYMVNGTEATNAA